jgi:uncharacterized protein (DUF952 family)
MTLILHIARPDEWREALAKSEYRGNTLETEGFIHCSTPAQIVRTANKYYSGQTGLLLLCIESDLVRSTVKFEPPIDPQTHQPVPGAADLFPHIYGPLNTDAVFKTVAFSPGSDGVFTLPEEIPAG